MAEATRSAPAWARRWLLAAGVYNIIWGAAVVLAPLWFFRVAGMEPPRYPAIWQCVGMIVGVYGVGYIAAARDSIRHWPIVLVGLLGKIFGPVGFVMAASRGELPWTFGWVIVFNDLIWWAPFGMMLLSAARAGERSGDGMTIGIDSALDTLRDHRGETLRRLTDETPTLVVLLRHAGCVFCREAIADLGAKRAAIEAAGVRLILVHMGDDASLAPITAKHGLAEVSRVSDPERLLYRALELRRGTIRKLFGLKVWMRGFAAWGRGNRIGRMVGDGFQMPGVFLFERGKVVREFRHETAADRPDYASIACPAPGAA